MADAVVVLSETAARALTERIKRAGDEFGAMLVEAHDGEAWRALGYPSWRAYVEAEFEFTRQHSYRLLTQARVSQIVGEHVTHREAQAVDSRMREISGNSVTHGRHIDASPAQSDAYVRALSEQRQAAPKPSGGRRSGGPRNLTAHLNAIRAAVEAIEAAFDEAGDDALSYLSPDDLRLLNRTVATAWAWADGWVRRL